MEENKQPQEEPEPDDLTTTTPSTEEATKKNETNVGNKVENKGNPSPSSTTTTTNIQREGENKTTDPLLLLPGIILHDSALETPLPAALLVQPPPPQPASSTNDPQPIPNNSVPTPADHHDDDVFVDPPVGPPAPTSENRAQTSSPEKQPPLASKHHHSSTDHLHLHHPLLSPILEDAPLPLLTSTPKLELTPASPQDGHGTESSTDPADSEIEKIVAATKKHPLVDPPSRSYSSGSIDDLHAHHHDDHVRFSDQVLTEPVKFGSNRSLNSLPATPCISSSNVSVDMAPTPGHSRTQSESSSPVLRPKSILKKKPVPLSMIMNQHAPGSRDPSPHPPSPKLLDRSSENSNHSSQELNDPDHAASPVNVIHVGGDEYIELSNLNNSNNRSRETTPPDSPPGSRRMSRQNSLNRRPSGHNTPEEPAELADVPAGVRPWDFAGHGSAHIEFLDVFHSHPVSSADLLAPSTHYPTEPTTPAGSNFRFFRRLSALFPRPRGWSFGFFGDSRDDASTSTSSEHKDHALLDEWPATAICGNDITSSCLYVAGICAHYAGFWAPICLFIVSGLILFLYRFIYSEVITALPVNGGSYTLLLNTTSKVVAGACACLTLLSYIGTAVVSASVAISYLSELASISQGLGTTAVLAGFALLTLLGVKDSARTALALFAFHITVMLILIGDSLRQAINDDFAMLKQNYHDRNNPPGPELNITSTDNSTSTDGVAFREYAATFQTGFAFLYGFSSAMLGITGFESSANFVEEQKPGVFVKTLRNMWMFVFFLNPTLSVLSLSVLPLYHVMGYPLDSSGHPSSDDLLISMAGPTWLKKLVGVDGFLVLCGAVLTSYVGVQGLVNRMSLDRCLPAFLAAKNKRFQSHHIIIIGFFLLCTSLFFMSGMNILIMSGVYTTSFLCVMALFAVGNLILKYKRARIYRKYRASVPVVIIALSGVIVAIYGNSALNTSVLAYFVLYYFAAFFVVFIMLYRAQILEIILKTLVRNPIASMSNLTVEAEEQRLMSQPGVRGWVIRTCLSNLNSIRSQRQIFFIRTPDIRMMNKVVLYVTLNEQTENLMFVHICPPPANAPEHPDHNPDEVETKSLLEADLTSAEMSDYVAVLQKVYPKLRLDFLAVYTDEPFGREVIEQISEEHDVPRHFMFLSCPSARFPHDIGKLGGLRLITG